jgi:hypothetical protein
MKKTPLRDANTVAAELRKEKRIEALKKLIKPKKK